MGMYAWFIDSEGKKNKTTIAENLDVEVVEPNFPVDGVDDVQPGQTIVKDPAVKNNSDTLTGWLFTEIRVPIAEVKVEGAEAAERLPLFSFDVNNGWVVLQDPFEDGENNEMVYRYGWDATVAPNGAQTGNVFESVTFVNLDGGAQGLALTEQLVKVIGYGIQDAEQFEGDVRAAWIAYKLQNGIQDGEPLDPGAAVAAVTLGAPGNKMLKITATVPAVGDTVDGYEVLQVVEDIESLPASASATPLTEHAAEIKSVVAREPFKPVSTANWFRSMPVCERIDISGMDNVGTVTTDDMFADSPGLSLVITGPNMTATSAIPQSLEEKSQYYWMLKDPSEWQFWFENNGEKWLGPNDIVEAANDISANGGNSSYWAQYKGFMDSDKPMYIKWSDGTIHTAQIIGMCQDDLALSGGRAGLTFMFIDCLDEACRFDVDNDEFTGWRDSELRYRMNPAEITYDAKLHDVPVKSTDFVLNNAQKPTDDMSGCINGHKFTLSNPRLSGDQLVFDASTDIVLSDFSNLQFSGADFASSITSTNFYIQYCFSSGAGGAYYPGGGKEGSGKKGGATSAVNPLDVYMDEAYRSLPYVDDLVYIQVVWDISYANSQGYDGMVMLVSEPLDVRSISGAYQTKPLNKDHMVWESVPDQLRAAIKIVNKKSYAWDSPASATPELITTADGLWLGSAGEFLPAGQQTGWDGNPVSLMVSNEAPNGQYLWAKNKTISYANNNGVGNPSLVKNFYSKQGKSCWWARSISEDLWNHTVHKGSAICVYTDGDLGAYESAIGEMGVVPFFCL